MHHAVPQGTIVPWDTALCSAILRPPEVKSCRIVWCVIQREHIVENPCDLLGFKYFQRLLSTQFIHSKSSWTFYCAFYKDILPFLSTDIALKNKIDDWTKWQIFLGTPGYSLCHHFAPFIFGRSQQRWCQPGVWVSGGDDHQTTQADQRPESAGFPQETGDPHNPGLARCSTGLHVCT